ncbi:MAG: M1 family aminopeptidase [Dyella sp.]
MRRRLVVAIALALAAVTGTEQSFATDQAVIGHATPSRALTPTQLPRGITPSHYDVALVPHAQSLSFDGTVTATIAVAKPTRSITLNALDLSFSSVSLTDATGKLSFAAPKVSVDAATQTATFTFAQPIPAGSYRLAMSYTGKIGTQAVGIFALDYDSKGGKQRALYTQFENSDARRMIPSWDEPAYKASFTLEVTVPSDEMAVNNMPVASRTDLGNGLSRVRFETTPNMSTYLLFFGLGKFERATTSSDGTEIGVITQQGSIGQAQFTLDSAKAVLHEYNDYFGVPYPLPKLDNIAAPGSSQFFAAMENWGAIFTFESSLLLDPAIATQSDSEEVFNTAAHEMAHQWFGDLVTMRWWDDLWLNEGFASWMASRATAKLHPEWNTAIDAVSVREAAMARDAIATTHPVVQHVETVEQANQAFDSITYSKGEAIIGMLEAYVGHDTWRDGVRRYIKANAYNNTVSDDLWKAMDAVAPGKHVSTIAHDFTLQPGIPLIRAEASQCADGKTVLSLSQGEFTRDRPDKQPLRWHVPVIAEAVGGSPVSTVVTDGKASVSVPGCGPILVNAGQSGYYRTLYAPAQFAALKGAFTKLAPIDQLGLMGDTWALGLAGLQSAADYLELVKLTPLDADPTIWGEIAESLRQLNNYYRGDMQHQPAFQAFAIARLTPVLARIGWQPQAGEAGPVKILRSELIATLSALGDHAVIEEARRRYAAGSGDAKAMPGELRTVILGVVASHVDAAGWDQLHATAKAETTPLIKERLYALLATSDDVALAQRALDLALTDEPGATNSASMIRIVALNHPELAFDFAVAHRERIDQLIDAPSRSRYYAALAGSSLDLATIDKIKAFAQAHIAPSSRRVADTSIANIQYSSTVRKQRLPQIDAWLKQN